MVTKNAVLLVLICTCFFGLGMLVKSTLKPDSLLLELPIERSSILKDLLLTTDNEWNVSEEPELDLEDKLIIRVDDMTLERRLAMTLDKRDEYYLYSVAIPENTTHQWKLSVLDHGNEVNKYENYDWMFVGKDRKYFEWIPETRTLVFLGRGYSEKLCNTYILACGVWNNRSFEGHDVVFKVIVQKT